MSNDADAFVEALDRAKLFPGEKAVNDLLVFRGLLLEWNRRMNLISRADESLVLSKHALDSVCLLNCIPFSRGMPVVDLGTGAGFPGIPMAIIRPDLQMTLVEAKRKRFLFLRHVVRQLALSSVELKSGRFESLSTSFSTAGRVVSRAVSDLLNLAGWTAPFLRPRSGQLIVMKGREVEKEIDRLSPHRDRLGIAEIQTRPLYPESLVRQGGPSQVVIVSFAGNHPSG